jgi:glycosyltransferase involved in cell wall biosynthesis
MARIGANPARGKITNYRPAQVTVCMVTYIPDLSGYFEHRLEILRLVLTSLQAHTSSPHEVMVFDNNSCAEVVGELRRMQSEGQVNYLILSDRNLGKIDALRVLFSAAPGEIIAYNDDDILFYPGWLEAHLEILGAFPQVGMVSGTPVRNAAAHARQSLDALAESGAPGLSVSRQRRIPDAWEADWAVSTGRDPQAHLQATQDTLDLVFSLEKPGGAGACQAIGSANHFQFVAPRPVILQALPPAWTGKLMGSMIELDEAIDRLGYLRLSTVERYTRHLGNTLSPEVIGEARALGLLSAAGEKVTAPSPIRRKHGLLRIPGSRRVLSALYHRLFEILYR